MLNYTFVKEIFSRLSGKYWIKRIIDNHGYGEGVAYFLQRNPNELIYKEELKIHYNNYDHQIHANKEYRYILEDDNIVKYFAGTENSLFHCLDFIDNTKAIGNHLCGSDQYNATYIFLNPDSFTLNYQILGPQKNYNINRLCPNKCGNSKIGIKFDPQILSKSEPWPLPNFG